MRRARVRGAFRWRFRSPLLATRPVRSRIDRPDGEVAGHLARADVLGRDALIETYPVLTSPFENA